MFHFHNTESGRGEVLLPPFLRGPSTERRLHRLWTAQLRCAW